jgi:hypothetical protein
MSAGHGWAKETYWPDDNTVTNFHAHNSKAQTDVFGLFVVSEKQAWAYIAVLPLC